MVPAGEVEGEGERERFDLKRKADAFGCGEEGRDEGDMVGRELV